ncbi:hypothetical protein [Comamonas composti]|uniref:hypothetical protein n=1 Tax=Comamonas composti TaxID=408558 RepID=UPI000402765D|nr:hypothetical protein [Comamonas composti]
MTHMWKWALPAVFGSVLLAACGGDDSGTAPASTFKKAVEQLETTGQLPVLDRESSLAGLDSNGNGVRDDIERYVDGKSGTQSQKSSLKSLSAALTQAMLADLEDANALREATNAINLAVTCVWRNHASGEASPAVHEIEKITVNTRARYEAYMKFNSAMNGSVVKSAKEVNCG